MESEPRLKKPSVPILTVTNSTVRNGDSIYPTRNISYFGPGERPYGRVPRGIVIGVAALGFLLSFASLLSRGSSGGMGTFLVLVALGCVIWNIVGPVRNGVVLIVNSGDRVFFETHDKSGVARVAATIQAIFEKLEVDSEASFNFTDKRIAISHSTVTGPVNTGSYTDGEGSDEPDEFHSHQP